MQNPSDHSTSSAEPPDQQPPGASQQQSSRVSEPANFPLKPRTALLQGRRPGRHPVLPANVYRQSSDIQQCIRLLGWFSLGLGVAQLLVPRKVAAASGVPTKSAGLIRAVGVRELSSGIGLLTQPQVTPWVWSRVAGDALDLVLLGAAARHPHARRRQLALAATAVAGIAAVDIWVGMQRRRQATHPQGLPAIKGAINIDKRITINRPREECYRFWRDLENLPCFMQHLEDVEVLSDTHSRWRVRAPGGTSVEWESKLTNDQPDELLAWQALPGGDIDHTGSVSFTRAAGERGTVVRVSLEYKPPGGKPAALLAKLFGEEPAQQVVDDLRHFKQLIETGEIATTLGQSAGPRSPVARLLRKGEPG